ncbi:MAG: ABC transporter ATP-binding protein, partial [Saprospiraceae bacterium]
MKNSISVQGITKYYGKNNQVKALNNIQFDVEEGTIFGLIGPDGAGKTTLFRILTTLLIPSSGKATVNGFDVIEDYRSIREIVGYMPGKFSLYGDLSVRENLHFFATIFHTTIEKNYDLIKDIYVQLEPFNNRRASALSGGMKQKLALCCALIHRPKVLFLDEPTTGVDSVSRKEFWAMLKKLKKSGITIFVSTPYMDEATLCDKIALIQDGNIFSTSSPEDLIDSFPNVLWGFQSNDMFKLFKYLSVHPTIDKCHTFGAYHH